MVTHSKALLGLLILASSADAFWRMSCGIIQTGRVDPIISPGKVAGHVHKVSGASNFGLTNTFEDLQSSQCTTCDIQDDKSAYWTPQLFYQHGNGTFQLVPNGGTVIYYLGRGENRTNIEPFPPGFKMLSGSSSARSKDKTTMTYSTGRYAGRPVSDRVSFACLDSSGPMKERDYMFRTDCDYGMRAQVHFQSCWNGGGYQEDQSHVAYMSQIDNGICPPTHPRKLPHLFFEVIYDVNKVEKTKGGKFVFANGDTTGYGFHGDFMNGWDTKVLTQAIKQCINNDQIGGQTSQCPPLAASLSPYSSNNCPEKPPIVNENVRGLLPKLPGCNPVTSGPEKATQQICSMQPPVNDITPDSPRWDPAVGEKLGTWAYVGCAAEVKSRTLSKYSIANDNMTIDTCLKTCKAQGFPLAGLENGRECWCSDELAAGASYMKAATCASTPKMVCKGDSSQWCGAPNLLTVWNDTSYKAPAALVAGKTKILKDNSATYMGCWAEPSSGRALTLDRMDDSKGMTNEMCAQYCKDGGYTYAGTEWSQECYCGNDLGGKDTGDISQCSMKCKGDLFSYCGAGSRLSVWKLDQPEKSNDPVTALDGTVLYMGCWTDGGAGGRSLPSASFAGPTVSLETCSAFCKKGGWSMFGMEYSSECYCGNALKKESTEASENDCKMKCAGNSSQKCGAGNRLSVWSFQSKTTAKVAKVQEKPAVEKSTTAKSSAATQSTQPQYVGCYSEATKGRALASAKLVDKKKMTVEVCSNYCKGKGYAYMGLENGQECYCNNAGPSGGSKKVGEKQCNVKCTGSKAQLCGAKNRLNVYKIPTTTTAAKAAPAKVAAAKTTTTPAAKKAAAKPTTTMKTTSTKKKRSLATALPV